MALALRVTMRTTLGFALLASLILAAPSRAGELPRLTLSAAPSDLAPLPSAAVSYLTMHVARVEHDLLLFRVALPPEQAMDPLQQHRDQDRMTLDRVRSPLGLSYAIGPALFDAMVALAAHSPVRAPFDHTVHLGPAVFDGGGMGLGFGGRFL
jgi:hypothetical protein